MDSLTERQTEILKLIRELTESTGYPPTRAEIARSMGFRSVNAAEQHLRALERKGVLEISSGASRGIRLRTRSTPRLGRLMELPVVGRVAAGSPILAEETVTATAGGGVIKVTVTGDQRCLAVEIAPEVLEDADVEMLQDLILTAVNAALDQSRDMAAERLAPFAGGLPF